MHDTDKVLDTAAVTKPDIIILDLKMPKKWGFQVAQDLKYFLKTIHIPIIAMSAYFNEHNIELLNLCGIKKYLRKPLDLEELFTTIESMLKKNRRGTDRDAVSVANGRDRESRLHQRRLLDKKRSAVPAD